ncbi:DUF881 domain-containing protein [Actinomycetaceae bacterium TAE3-ERU4]|nr:DUF881 domain-containing protein [Actinomycetaceae bacterium TAE3-ERU4]
MTDKTRSQKTSGKPTRIRRHLRANRASMRTKRSKLYFLTVATTVVAGTLLGVSAANFGGGRQATDLKGLIRNEEQSALNTRTTNERIRQEIQQLLDSVQTKQPKISKAAQILAGTKSVTGPGLTVELSDAANPPSDKNVNLNDYVVHQQDIESVMNALWAGGAEAMSVQGHRITFSSKVRCVGNVIYVDGLVHSPPFIISAIGNPEQLQKAIDEDNSMEIYRQYVALRGLGYSVSKEINLKIPAASEISTLDSSRK